MYETLIRELDDGRAIHLYPRMYNLLLTVSPSIDSPTWDDGY